MKSAVVFYSLDGNTRAVAKEISKKFGAEIFELKETKQRQSGSKSFMKAGFQALFGIKTKLKNTYYDDLRNCGMIYLGTPIWAGKAAPAINSFVSGLEAKGKKFYVFTLQGSDVNANPCSGAIKLIHKLEAKGADTINAVSFKGGGVNECISEQDAARIVDESM